MTPAPRKKQPEIVRHNLLRAAAEIAAEQGLDLVTTAEVAKRAGVTSGGLFHHFPSKKHLIDALIGEFSQRFERLIEETAQRDPDPRGRFTRAYLVVSHSYEQQLEDNKLLGEIFAAVSRDSEWSETWVKWVDGQLAKYGREEDPVLGRIIRYAADGLWMEAFITPYLRSDDRQAAIRRLMDWTRQL